MVGFGFFHLSLLVTSWSAWRHGKSVEEESRRGWYVCIVTSRCCRLLSNAFEELIAFQRALKDFVASVDATYAKQYEDFYIGLEGSFGSKHVSPRTLTACFLSCIVCVEGIVTKCETRGKPRGFGSGGPTCLLRRGWSPPGAMVRPGNLGKGNGGLSRRS